MPLPNQNPSGLIEEPINGPGASSGGSSTAAPSTASGLIEEPISGTSASTPGPSSDPSQSHWYDPVVNAYKWATSPIRYSRPGPLKYFVPESPAQAAQEDEAAAHEL